MDVPFTLNYRKATAMFPYVSKRNKLLFLFAILLHVTFEEDQSEIYTSATWYSWTRSYYCCCWNRRLIIFTKVWRDETKLLTYYFGDGVGVIIGTTRSKNVIIKIIAKNIKIDIAVCNKSLYSRLYQFVHIRYFSQSSSVWKYVFTLLTKYS